MDKIAKAYEALKGDLSNSHQPMPKTDQGLFFSADYRGYFCSSSKRDVGDGSQYICAVEEFNKYKPQKTVIDAVNEFKGRFPSVPAFKDDGDEWLILLCKESHGEDGHSWSRRSMYQGCTGFSDRYFDQICTREEFNTEVESMSTNYGKCSHRELVTWQAELKEAKETKVDYTSEEFWKDAPESATHWDNLADCFCKKEGYWHSNNVNRYVEHDDQNMWGDPSRYESRPKPSPVFTKAMSDAGELPQVGMEVEVNNCGNIYNYDVLFISDQYFIGTDGINEQHFHTSSIKIKPIDTRTDKEKAIDDLSKCVGDCMSDYGILQEIIAGNIHGVTFNH